MRHILTKIAAACALLGLPAAAQADPISLIAIGAGLGFTGTAALVVGAISAYGGYALLGLQIYGGIDARRRAKAAQRDATRRYNASVTDRSVTVLQGTPPWRIVYGEAITGGSVVAIFTSDKTTVSSGGTAGTKPDGLKHMVILMASHEVEALGELFIDGVSLGTLDGSGYSTSSDWTTGAAEKLVTVTFTSTTTLTAAATAIVSATTSGATEGGPWDVDRTVAISGGGLTLTVTDGLGSDQVTVIYKTSVNPSVIRVQKHLGSDSQTVDTYLNSVKPTEWDSSHRLRGCAYLVVTLDLEEPRFQGGPPNLTCRVKGKKLYDPRKDSTNGGTGSHRYATPSTWEWSDNPALCARDWIVGEYGMAHDNADILDSFTIAAANACDVTFSFTIGITGFTQPTYRCNGVATTEEAREAVLDKLADSMAGFAIYGAQWQILAGAWTAPVMDLTDDDLDGQIEVIQAGAGIDELFNGVRGTYIGAGSASPTDFEPYQNSTFVTADGEPLWQDVGLTFTNSKPHCANIARILVERGRNSQVIQYPAKLRAWPLQIGDRVTVTSAEYGITTPKPYRVTDWQFGLSAPVTLALQEDAADAYDTVDAVDADPTPNTDLPAPWLVEAIALNTPASGTNHLLRANDGTIITRVWVSWSALTGAYLKDGRGRVVVRWRRVGPDADWQEIQADASDAGVYLLGVQDGDRVVIEAWAVNDGGFRGASDTALHTVLGKTAAPSNVAGAAGAISKGRIRWGWTPSADVDYGRTEVRAANSGWGGSGALWVGTASDWQEPVSAAGSVTRYFKHVDTSGNPSATAASVTVTVTAADLIETIAADVVAAQATADGKISSFYQASAPGSAEDGDIWFDTDDANKQYIRTGGAWVLAADTRIGDALTAASDAQATADGKVVTFVATTAPTAEAVGDLWLDTDDGNKIYRWSGSAWVALPVGTGGIDTNAATKTHSATASGVSVTGEKGVPTGTFTDLVSYTFTPAADCEVQITVEGSVNITTGASGFLVDYAMLSTRVLQGATQLGPLRTYAIDQQIGFSKTAQATISRVQRFAATGGVSYTVKVQGQQYTTSTTCTVDDIAMRIEEIKR